MHDLTHGYPVLIVACGCRGADAQAIESAVTRCASRGIRTLAVGKTTGDNDDFQLAALITFLDPPRPDTEETIQRAYALGVDVKMITGVLPVLYIEFWSKDRLLLGSKSLTLCAAA